ncbi:MAG: hypothetical protein ACRENQ_01450 [Gemmatimonadaceae bacterium]
MSELSRGTIRALTIMALPALLVAACSKQAQPPKQPLGQMTAAAGDSQANPHDTMSPAARAALDSGNAQYRANNYAAALKSYRQSSDLAPLNAAPFFGIYMAAEKLGNKALADSATAQIRRLGTGSNAMLTDSALENLHAKGQAKPNKN